MVGLCLCPSIIMKVELVLLLTVHGHLHCLQAGVERRGGGQGACPASRHVAQAAAL